MNLYQKMWASIMRGPMKKTEEPKARTFHNLECSRLRGGKCDCKMAVTFTPPEHFTGIDSIHYTDPSRPTVVEFANDRTVRVYIDGVVVDIIHPYHGGEAPIDVAKSNYPGARVLGVEGYGDDDYTEDSNDE